MLPVLALLGLLAAPSFAEDGQELCDHMSRDSRENYRLALGHGAIVKPTPDRRSCYIYWSPELEPPEETSAGKAKAKGKKGKHKKEQKKARAPKPKRWPKRVLVTLHGESGWALDEFLAWRQAAAERGIGILALQWWFGRGQDLTDYYTPHEVYRNIDELLKFHACPPGRAMLHGFNRGASSLYGIAGIDRTEGRRYFALMFADAGGADRDSPINRMMEKGGFGASPLAGSRWALYCGKLDSQPRKNGCPAMARTEKWIGRLGGDVNLVIEDPQAGNGGLYQTPDHMASVLDLFTRLAPGEPEIVLPEKPKPKARKGKSKPKPKPKPEPEDEPKPEPEAAGGGSEADLEGEVERKAPTLEIGPRRGQTPPGEKAPAGGAPAAAEPPPKEAPPARGGGPDAQPAKGGVFGARPAEPEDEPPPDTP